MGLGLVLGGGLEWGPESGSGPLRLRVGISADSFIRLLPTHAASAYADTRLLHPVRLGLLTGLGLGLGLKQFVALALGLGLGLGLDMYDFC